MELFLIHTYVRASYSANYVVLYLSSVKILVYFPSKLPTFALNQRSFIREREREREGGGERERERERERETERERQRDRERDRETERQRERDRERERGS